MLLCSHLEYPEKKKTDVPTGTCCPLLCLSRRTRPCTRAPRPNSGLGPWKNCVFTLMSSEYRTRAPLPYAKYERCLRASNMSRQLQGNFQRSKRCHWFSSSDKCWGHSTFPCYRIKFNGSWVAWHLTRCFLFLSLSRFSHGFTQRTQPPSLVPVSPMLDLWEKLEIRMMNVIFRCAVLTLLPTILNLYRRIKDS